MEYTPFLVLLASLLLTGLFFLKSLILSFRKDVLWLKFMAFGLLNSAITSMLVIYYGDGMLEIQNNTLGITAFFFIFLAALFYWAYQLNQKENDDKKS